MSAALPRSSVTAGIEADEHVRRAAEVARHRQAVEPTNMSAALPRSSDTAGPPRGSRADEHVRRAAEGACHRGPWGRRVRRAAEVARHRGAAAGIEADEHFRRAAEVEHHRGAAAEIEADEHVRRAAACYSTRELMRESFESATGPNRARYGNSSVAVDGGGDRVAGDDADDGVDAEVGSPAPLSSTPRTCPLR